MSWLAQQQAAVDAFFTTQRAKHPTLNDQWDKLRDLHDRKCDFYPDAIAWRRSLNRLVRCSTFSWSQAMASNDGDAVGVRQQPGIYNRG